MADELRRCELQAYFAEGAVKLRPKNPADPPPTETP